MHLAGCSGEEEDHEGLQRHAWYVRDVSHGSRARLDFACGVWGGAGVRR